MFEWTAVKLQTEVSFAIANDLGWPWQNLQVLLTSVEKKKTIKKKSIELYITCTKIKVHSSNLDPDVFLLIANSCML